MCFPVFPYFQSVLYLRLRVSGRRNDPPLSVPYNFYVHARCQIIVDGGKPAGKLGIEYLGSPAVSVHYRLGMMKGAGLLSRNRPYVRGQSFNFSNVLPGSIGEFVKQADRHLHVVAVINVASP